jgi:mannose-1-phosphate guanylyltransferase
MRKGMPEKSEARFKGSDPSIIPVILSGGAGTRLWPLSRELYPKQFLPLVGERTMIQETALRAAGVPGATAPIVVCNEAHRFLVAEQFGKVGIGTLAILLEPAGRNTAPAVAVAALAALARAKRDGIDTEPLLLVLPADHALSDLAAFTRAIDAAIPAAVAGRLVAFGVVPTGP